MIFTDNYSRALFRIRLEKWRDILTPKVVYHRGQWGHESDLAFRIYWFGPRLHREIFDVTRMKMYRDRRPLWRVRILGLVLINEIH